MGKIYYLYPFHLSKTHIFISYDTHSNYKIIGYWQMIFERRETKIKKRMVQAPRRSRNLEEGEVVDRLTQRAEF